MREQRYHPAAHQAVQAEGKVGFEYHYRSRPPISRSRRWPSFVRLRDGTRCVSPTFHAGGGGAHQTGEARGTDVYLETCPHYLFLTEEAIDTYGPTRREPPVLRQTVHGKDVDYVKDGSVTSSEATTAPSLSPRRRRV